MSNNTAQNIVSRFTTETENDETRDIAKILEQADLECDSSEQDWDNETTTFKFVDGSVLVVCGEYVGVYASE